MIDVGVAAVPNQRLSIQLEERVYFISLRECNGGMTASIERDGEIVVSNTRVLAGAPLLPYRYQEAGNFIVTTRAEEIPYYDQFGATQFLVYVSVEELAAFRVA